MPLCDTSLRVLIRRPIRRVGELRIWRRRCKELLQVQIHGETSVLAALRLIVLTSTVNLKRETSEGSMQRGIVVRTDFAPLHF